MWILPKNYQLSSAFAQDMVESREDLTLLGSSIESSLMWRSKPSLLRTWSQRWNRVSWFQRLSSRILKPSQRISFETALTSLLEDTRASRFQQQESDLEPKTPDTYGPTSLTTSDQYDLFGASLRTLKDTSALASEKSLATWKEQVIKQRGEYSQRLKSARLTSESGFTSWAATEIGTPTASMTVRSKEFRKGRTPSPAEFVQMWPTPRANKTTSETPETWLKRQAEGSVATPPLTLAAQMGTPDFRQWPTPTAQDTTHAELELSKDGRRLSKDGVGTHSLGLADAVKNWPTPSARDHKGGYQGGRIRNGKVSVDTLDVAVQHYSGDKNKVGHLNPEWVEWLMGVPTGWTGLGSWETE